MGEMKESKDGEGERVKGTARENTLKLEPQDHAEPKLDHPGSNPSIGAHSGT